MAHIVPHPLALFGGLALAIIILVDAFEAIILPRRVTRKIRVTRLFFRTTWGFWKFVVGKISSRKTREALLGGYGPCSLLLLIAIWALGLVLSFGMMQYAAGSAIDVHEPGHSGFAMDVYLSATTFFTLGLGDAVPRVPLARFLLVAEAGLGYGFLAVIVGYLPFIYTSFSRREVNISLLGARRDAADRRRTSAALQLCRRPRSLARPACGMGIVVRGIDGEPSFLSGACIFPLET